MLKDPKNQKMIQDFISEHAPLIHKHINILQSKGMIPEGVEHDDLHLAGIHGLVDALHRYDHDVGERLATHPDQNPFTKYAERRIQGKMLDHIHAQDEVPMQLKQRAKNLAAIRAKGTIPED